MEPSIGRPRRRPGQTLQPRIRSRNRLRRISGGEAAHRAGSSPGGVAVLAPLLHRRRGHAGGDAGKPAAAGACLRRRQLGIRGYGTADAPRRNHFHPPQHRQRSAVQIRAPGVRRLRGGETVQPQLVHRGHPLAYREDAAAQAWADELCGRRLPGWPQRRHSAARGFDQLRPAARDRRVRCLRPWRREACRGLELDVQLHQGPGRTQLRQDLRPLPRSRLDARVSRPVARPDRRG